MTVTIFYFKKETLSKFSDPQSKNTSTMFYSYAPSLNTQSHTDQFLVEMFHNYAFNECISVENLKLWLLILTKTLF